MQVIYTWIKNIVLYMILNTIVNNLIGTSSYKKYISLASGMILVIIVISPVTKLLKTDDIISNLFNYNQLSIEVSDFKNNLIDIESESYAYIFKELEEKIRQEVEKILLSEKLYIIKFKVIFNENYKEDDFAKIQSMDIVASEEVENEKKIDKVEKIVIKKEKPKKIISPKEIIIKDKLSDFYNLENDNINIIIHGGIS